MTTPTTATLNFYNGGRDLDLPLLRHELESASALTLPDLSHELCCQREELPGLHFWEQDRFPTDWQVARLMATCFEAGRRYGLMAAIAMCSQDILPDGTAGVTALQRKYGHTRTMRDAAEIAALEYDPTLHAPLSDNVAAPTCAGHRARGNQQ